MRNKGISRDNYLVWDILLNNNFKRISKNLKFMTLNKYVRPQVREVEIDEEENLLAGSGYGLNDSPTSGLGNNAPSVGSEDGESHEVCAKQNVQSLWDE